MKYYRGKTIPSSFEPNELSFGSKLKGNLSQRSNSIQFEYNLKSNFSEGSSGNEHLMAFHNSCDVFSDRRSIGIVPSIFASKSMRII